MKKLLLSFCAIAALSANAQQDKQLVRIDTYSVTTDETGNETTTFSYSSPINYYDKTNVLVMDQNNYTRNFYTYNADGTVAAVQSYGWTDGIGWTYSEAGSRTYEYDADGNLLKAISSTGCTQYSDYQHGEYAKMENVGADGVAFYTANYKLYFDEQNRLTRRETLATDGVTVQQFTACTYTADGKIATTHMAYMEADGSESKNNWADETYTYNADGTIKSVRSVSNSRYGLLTNDMIYVYATYSSSYAPQNIKATVGEKSTVTVSWDAVSGADKYIVIYDQKTDTVATTSLTTASLLDGEHSFYVQAIIGGEAKNISDAATASVKDTGKLPASDFKVLSVTETEDQWGSLAFAVNVQFALPEGHSGITGYKLFYDEGSSWSKIDIAVADVTVEGNIATLTAILSTYNVSYFDPDTYESVLTTKPLFVVITYASGDSENSNIEMWDFAANASSIASLPTAAKTAAIYTVNGAQVSEIQHGINIVKMTDGTVKKVIVK